MKKRKKGAASHIEMIFSFVLFSLFVFFLVLYIKPYKTDRLTETIVDSLESKFVEYNQVELNEIFIGVESDSNCVKIDLGQEINGNSVVKDIDKQDIFDSSLSGTKLSINSNDDYFYVYISDEFSNSDVGCSPISILNEDNYTIGNINEIIVLGNDNINDLISMDYEDVRQELKVPESVDFLISSEDFEIGVPVPEGIEIIAKDYELKFLNSNGDIERKEVLFRIW